MEGVKVETYFMSERASLFLSSIGLLGEYCPSSRKKNRHSFVKVCCMQPGSFLERSQGCQFMRPFPFARISPNFEKEVLSERVALLPC